MLNFIISYEKKKYQFDEENAAIAHQSRILV